MYTVILTDSLWQIDIPLSPTNSLIHAHDIISRYPNLSYNYWLLDPPSNSLPHDNSNALNRTTCYQSLPINQSHMKVVQPIYIWIVITSDMVRVNRALTLNRTPDFPPPRPLSDALFKSLKQLGIIYILHLKEFQYIDTVIIFP